jgi:hypothetical protein
MPPPSDEDGLVPFLSSVMPLLAMLHPLSYSAGGGKHVLLGQVYALLSFRNDCISAGDARPDAPPDSPRAAFFVRGADARVECDRLLRQADKPQRPPLFRRLGALHFACVCVAALRQL